MTSSEAKLTSYSRDIVYGAKIWCASIAQNDELFVKMSKFFCARPQIIMAVTKEISGNVCELLGHYSFMSQLIAS